ncbi:nucleoside deaminase [Hyphomicrobium sp.]|uniref:nucleoside deaminase n=1 Tax=Hyphomicrobium sp. TaxID=82 RepID=UPI000FBA523F|nr:nucleoside deaminase [Hyphomicrobium sp.]RUP08878.1 MAG: nucleoside deaminase [Hyphomicrobium sp.]
MHRRTVLQGGLTLVATAIAGSNDSHARQAPVMPDDARFMKLAIEEAAKAEFPFGAVIVKNGEVLARGHNRTRADRDPTAHGEMVAIRAFLSAHGPDMFEGTTLYTSGEPCCMCMGAILWCGIGRLVYAAPLQQLSTKVGQIMLSAEDVASKASFVPIEISGPVLSEDALRLFK